MSQQLPKVEVKEIHYWAVILHDQFRPNGQEWPTRFATQEEAEAKISQLVAKTLVARL